ncbi:TonB-dependent receptor [Luteitalea sp.]|uniref:TonB-dependent receptor n=1 Tax=Luteitalea sp. TaxID=2004800 RepID=UPI0025BC85DD|nr:TonB-dependent receptor [Luteitalea sp.]
MIRRAIWALLAAVLCAAPAMAQETTGRVAGTVIDTSNAAIPGASVKIEGGAVNQMTVTDGEGKFSFAALSPGTYRLTTTLQGFKTSVVDDLQVAIGKTSSVNVSLSVGGLAEQVTVEASSVRLDTAQTTIQTNVTAATIENLPKGTNMTSLLKLAPAARQEPLSGGFQIDGASGSENSFMIDGLETGNFRTGVLNVNNNLPFEFIQEMSIKTSGFNAEFGGATGGVINVVTKSGTNQFRGLGGIEFESDGLNGDPRGRLNRFRSGTGANFVQVNEYLNDKTDKYTNYYPVLGVGGPILRDKAWFFASYSPQIFDETRTTEYFSSDPRTRTKTGEQTYTRNRKSEYFQGRVDAQPSNTVRLTGTYTYNPYIEEGIFPHSQISLGNAPPSVNFGGSTGILTGPDLTTKQGGKQDGGNFSVGATWTPGSKLVLSSRVSRGYLNELLNSKMIPQETRFRCINNAPPAGAGCGLGFDSFPTNSQRFEDSSERWTVDSSAAFLVDGFAGRHEFKVGHQYSRVANDVNTGYVPYGIVSLSYGFTINDLTGRNDPVTPGAIGAGVIQRFGTVGAAANTANSIYFQDRWQPTNRLTINAGVRMEKEDLPSFNGFAPPINFGFGDKVVPRLGVAYDLTGDGRTKIFASFNKFQDRLKFELPRGSFGGDFFRNDYFEIMPGNVAYDFYTINRILGSNTDVLGGQCPIVNSTGLSRCQYDFRIASNDPNADIYTGKVDPDLKPFTQTEFTAGLERELLSSYLLSVRYTRKSVDHAIEDAGFPTAEGSEAYIIGNPGEGLHAETARQFGYAKTTKPERIYDALETRLERRFANNFQFTAAYTYSKLQGNYSGLASSDENGRTSPGVNRFFDLPHLGFTTAGTPDNGVLATDRPHVLNLFGSYLFNWGANQSTNVAAFTTFQSGTPQTTFYTFYAAAVAYGRNDMGRTPMFTNTDLMLSHRIRFGSRSVALELNILNLFDEANVLGFYSNNAGVNPSIATLGLPASVTDEPSALNYVLTNGITANYDAYLNNPAAPQRKDTAYGMDNSFQTFRAVRFGVKFNF